ncbi:DUF2397 family protein [Frankia sp. AiPs1]|uniref:DUF2397 family protein n=1 Tax=Frankia sp. AiPs1 TaxID=573493 RepID=UPI0020432FCF|nr:DUF2397 family protein [Frankia sp. AiPs1]MCM3920126.1 DUF2397 family protein [Frankia sp. AiPs1]
MRSDWWRGIEPDMWRFVGEPLGEAREDYAAILSALLRLSGSAPMSTMRDIAEQMRRDGYGEPMPAEQLRSRLDGLVQMRLVLPFLSPTAAREDLRDGHRRQEAWSLSKKGRIIVRSVRDAINDLDRVLALPPQLIESIQDTLRELLLHLDEGPMRVALDLTHVRSHLGQLLDAAGDYYDAMRMLNQQDVTDDEVFSESRARIMLVLRQFVQHTQAGLAPLRRSLQDVRATGYAVIAEAAAPGIGAMAPGGTAAWIDDAVADLESLDAWFSSGGNIDRIIDSALYAIDALLSAITRRYYASNRTSDLAADFHELARLLHAQESAEDADGVFAAATGLWAAQHPQVTIDDDDVLPAAITAAAPREAVSVSLRGRASSAAAPRAPRRMENLELSRQAEEQAATAELARLAELSAGLVTPGMVGLAHFAEIDGAHLEVLVALLEEALDSYDADLGFGEALTLRCRMRLTTGRPGQVVTIPTTEGTLTAPDVRVEISPVGAPATLVRR